MSLYVLQCIGFESTDFIYIVFVSYVLLQVKIHYAKKFRLVVSTVLVPMRSVLGRVLHLAYLSASPNLHDSLQT